MNSLRVITQTMFSRLFRLPVLIGVLVASGSILRSAPVDLSPPANSLGSMDRLGHLRLFQDLGRVELGGVEVPLRLDFSSGRLSEASELGWRGWRCGLLESSAQPWNGLDYLRVELLCAKTLYLKRDGEGTNTYTAAEGAWKGSLTEGRVRIWRNDGWELRYAQGRMERLVTDRGKAFVWERDAAGRFHALREEGGAELLGAEWDDNKTQLRAIFTPLARFEFEHDAKGNLSAVAWDQKTGIPRSLGIHLSEDSLELNSDRDGTSRYQWKPENGQLLKDSLGEYRVVADEGGPGRHRLMLRRNDGAVLVRLDDESKGISIRSRGDGSKIIVRRLTAEGPLHDSVARVDWVSGDESVILLRNHFGVGGRLEKREWRGDPREHTGFAGGRVDSAFTTAKSVVFPERLMPESVDRSAAMPLRTIQFLYDYRGRHVSTSLDGEMVYHIAYDAKGRVVLEEIPGRFRTTQEYGKDGRVATTVTPLDRPIAGDYHRDPGSRSGAVRVGTVIDAKGRVLEERFLDGHHERHQFDGEGRLSQTKTFAADGNTLLSTRAVVYHPDGRRRYETLEDLATKRTLRLEIYLAGDGAVIRELGVPATPDWVEALATPEGTSSSTTPRPPSAELLPER